MTKIWLPRLLFGILVLLLWRSDPAPAQEEPSVAGPARGGAPAAKNENVQVPITIAAGDLLNISVFDIPELTEDVRVDSDGSVRLALLGKVAVAGKTAPEAAQGIAERLRAENLVRSPQVNVLFKEYPTHGVSVEGEVQTPGVFPSLGPRTLLDFIALAGGLTGLADTKIVVKRRSGAQETISLKLKYDDAQQSLANNVQIYPGDLVLVPRAGIVYVLGDVARAGGFIMQDSGKMTLLQALAQAGGANKTAAVGHAVLLHKGANGYASMPVHVGRISRGLDADIELRANDILFVPNSQVRNLIAATDGAVSSMTAAPIYGVVR